MKAFEKEYKLHKSSACALRESTVPNEQPSFAAFGTLVPCNELSGGKYVIDAAVVERSLTK